MSSTSRSCRRHRHSLTRASHLLPSLARDLYQRRSSTTWTKNCGVTPAWLHARSLPRNPTLMATDLAKPDPGVVLDLLQAFRWSKVMFTAVSLGLFDTLGSGPKSLQV